MPTWGVVGLKQVGKPDFFKGSKEILQKEWNTSSYTFVTWFCSQYQRGEEALELTQQHKEDLTPTIVGDKSLEMGWLFIEKR